MSVKVRIPTPLRSLANGQDQIEVVGRTVREVLQNLEAKHPGLRARLCDSQGELRRFINLFLNDVDVRTKQGMDTTLAEGDTISIIPAIAGGALSGRDLLNEARKTQKEVSAAEVAEQLTQIQRPVIVDVRETEEFKNGHLPGAVHIARGFLELKVENLIPDRKTPLVLYCAGGNRSLLAAETLGRMGYENVSSMIGGFSRWAQEGRAVDKPFAFTDADRRRYARHLSIPEVGEAGQARLLQSKVLLIGAGGLGSPAAYYLAAAGVGTLGLVDFDVVDETNLQRQILHPTSRVGTSKIQSATKTLLDFNPALKIVPFEERLTSGNVDRIFEKFDLVVDGSDNFPTRYLVNDACVKFKKPCVHGSVYRFEGQATVFHPAAGGPCYRCLYPEPPPPELAPSCAEAGVLGVLPGVIGLIQAVEAIKVLLKIGHPLVGRLLAYDALESKFREFKLERDPGCRFCGEGKPFPGYVDYERFCSVAP